MLQGIDTSILLRGGFTQSTQFLLQQAQTAEGRRLLRLGFPTQANQNMDLLSNSFINGSSNANSLTQRLSDAQFNQAISDFDRRYGPTLMEGFNMNPEAALLFSAAQQGINNQRVFGESGLPLLGAINILEDAGLGGRFGRGNQFGTGTSGVPFTNGLVTNNLMFNPNTYFTNLGTGSTFGSPVLNVPLTPIFPVQQPQINNPFSGIQNLMVGMMNMLSTVIQRLGPRN